MIAVLISGQMRTLDKTVTSIKECYPNADFFVHAVQDKDSDKAFLLRPKALCIEPQSEMSERKEYTWQLGRGCQGVQGVLKQLWGLDRCWQLYESSGVQYDWVVRCRADLKILKRSEDPHQLPPAVYIPKFCNFFGYNDRFAFGPHAAMKRYFTRRTLLDQYINEGNIFHPESFLAWTLKGLPVARTNVVFSTLRENGVLTQPVYKAEWADVID
jgi:hypothetical protein